MMSRLAATLAAALAVALAAAAPAAAQSLNDLSKMGGGALGSGALPGQTPSAGDAALLGGLTSGSTSLSSPQNTAGALAYCQQQGYAPSAAATVKDRLIAKAGGQQKVSQDKGYLAGLGGTLQGGGGQSFSLGSLKDTVGKKVCAAIADRAVSSYLGD